MARGAASRKPSVLAVHSGALGDVILFGHLLRLVDAEVTLVAAGEKSRLLAGAGVVAEALDFDALPMHEVFSDAPLDQCALPALLGTHEKLVSCFGGDRSSALRMAAMCGATDAMFLPVRPSGNFRGHLLELWLDLLGLPTELIARVRPWNVPRPWRRMAAAELRKAGISPQESYLAIHPGSGSVQKCWPLERFIETAGRLGEAPRRLAVLFVLGPVEMDRWQPSATKRLTARFPVLVSPGLEVLAGALASAEAYLGNDSGVSHLAAAAGAATTVLFGPSRRKHFAPLGRAVRTIVAEELGRISVEEVLAAAGSLPEVQEYS